MCEADTVYHYLLKQIIDAGGVPIRLDSERSLASRFGVSLRAARSALQRLVREGHAVVQHGRGYFVRASDGHVSDARAVIGLVYRPEGTSGVIESRARGPQLAAMIARIQDLGMQAELLPTRERQASASLRRTVRDTPVDGYVLCSVSPGLQAFFAGLGKPAIVLGSTYDDLGLACVELNLLEVAQELTGRLFSEGHRRVCLLQERGPNVGWERARLGFECAHSVWQIRFSGDRIIRIDRQQRGLKPAMEQLAMLAPTGILVQNVPLLEWFWDRCDNDVQKQLADMEIMVLNADLQKSLKHAVTTLDVDLDSIVRMVTDLLADVMSGRQLQQRRMAIAWKLVSRPGDLDRGA